MIRIPVLALLLAGLTLGCAAPAWAQGQTQERAQGQGGGAPAPAPGAGSARTAPAPAPEAVVVPRFWDPRRRPERPDLTRLTAIRFMTETDYPPFNYAGPDGAPAGFNIDLARLICEEIKVACTVQMRRFDTLVDALNSNAGDAVIASIAATPDMRKRVDFSDPYYRTPARFVVRRGGDLQGGCLRRSGVRRCVRLRGRGVRRRGSHRGQRVRSRLHLLVHRRRPFEMRAGRCVRGATGVRRRDPHVPPAPAAGRWNGVRRRELHRWRLQARGVRRHRARCR